MQLTVLQWNVWYQADIEHIVELLRRVDADVVCLQELTKNQEGQSHSDTIGYIAEKLGGYHHSSQPMIRDDVQRQLFNAIFSRYELTRTSSQWINTPIGIGGHSDEFRAYIEATIKVGDRSVRIGTTHMSYTDRFEVTDRKRQEADNLVGCLRDKPDLIFTGDLNAPPDSYVVQQIREHLVHAGPSTDQNTWTTKPFDYGDFSELGLNWRLDYVFAATDIKIVSSEIISTEYSDHLPILVTFEITANGLISA